VRVVRLRAWCLRREAGMRLKAVWAGLFTVAICAGGLGVVPAAADAAVSVRASAGTGSAMAGTLTGVSCPTPLYCVSTGQLDSVSGGGVVGTTDGGHTWKPLTTPPAVAGLAGVSCPRIGRCEVVGGGNGDAGAVYGSHNGGQTWHAQSAVIIGGLFAAVACPSPTVCEATGNSGAIFGTTNGGQTWAQQQTPATASLVQAVSCPTTTTCEAVGYGDNRGMALRTTNGGSTWSAQPLPSSVQFLAGVACPTVRMCAAVGMNVTGGGSTEVGVVVTTTSSGRAWTQQPIPAGITDLAGVACPTADICEAGGLGPTAVIGTTDGGAAWTAQPISGSMFITAVTCPGTHRCEVVGENANDRAVAFGTANGGHSWTRQTIPGP
jgi:photosystem II stability/assembly factor-like uncharacterized protein